jgi:hypothetical protein
MYTEAFDQPGVTGNCLPGLQDDLPQAGKSLNKSAYNNCLKTKV